MTTIEREEARVRELFERVDTVVEVAHVIEYEHPDEAATLLRTSLSALSSAPPVRVTIAATLLHVSDRTVRAWVGKGLLRRVPHARLLLDPVRLHEVVQLVKELREAGRSRDLLTELGRRLQDEALLDRDDLAESLEQMRAGQMMPAQTLAEEPAASR